MTNRRLKVLLVDDSEICRETAKIMLDDYGFDVIALDSPLGFSVRMREHKPDVALIDVSMPALNGTHLVELAHRHGNKGVCPIILFSDRSRRELDALARQCGADGVISKSDDWPTIARLLTDFLRRAR